MKQGKLDNALYKIYLEAIEDRRKVWYPIERSRNES